MLIRAGLPLNQVSDDNYPEVVTALLVGVPAAVDHVVIYGESIAPNGDRVEGALGSINPTPYGLLQSAMAEEAASVLPRALVVDIARPQLPTGGDFLYIDGPNETGEIVMLDSYNPVTEQWTVARGIYDTVPRAWPAGTVVWYLGTGMDEFDPRTNSATVAAPFKALPHTVSGTLSPDSAAEVPHVPGERPYLPFRPANTQIAGRGFAEAKFSTSDIGGLPTSIPLTWANRNRTQEDGLAARWGESGVVPEAGQTTTLRFRARFQNVVELTVSGLTGESYNLDPNDLPTYRFYDVEFVSVRDGLESLQHAVRGLDIERLGYGNNYGFDYGENDGS
jgi:hypothetical protein